MSANNEIVRKETKRRELSREPSGQHIENIRTIEYNILMQDMLRQFKASIFQALAHPTRIAILEILREGEMPAGAIQERSGR